MAGAAGADRLPRWCQRSAAPTSRGPAPSALSRRRHWLGPLGGGSSAGKGEGKPRRGRSRPGLWSRCRPARGAARRCRGPGAAGPQHGAAASPQRHPRTPPPGRHLPQRPARKPRRTGAGQRALAGACAALPPADLGRFHLSPWRRLGSLQPSAGGGWGRQQGEASQLRGSPCRVSCLLSPLSIHGDRVVQEALPRPVAFRWLELPLSSVLGPPEPSGPAAPPFFAEFELVGAAELC